MAEPKCAHCDDGDGQGRQSMDDGRGVRCPACGEVICPSCRAMSGPTVCGSYADDMENADEILESEDVHHRRGRLAAYRRAGSPHVYRDYPTALRPRREQAVAS